MTNKQTEGIKRLWRITGTIYRRYEKTVKKYPLDLWVYCEAGMQQKEGLNDISGLITNIKIERSR